MNYQDIEYIVKDGIATITLNRPDRLNAFTLTMRDELLDAFDHADSDDKVRAIIVTGKGRAFCAGMELSEESENTNVFGLPKTTNSPKMTDIREGGIRDAGGTVTLRIYNCKKPVIAAINGPLVGIGITMTLAMDFRLATQYAKFGFVFSQRGIVPEACSSWFLPRVVGLPKALEWVYSGDIFPAQEGLQHGLFQSMHDPETLLADARDFAGRMTTMPMELKGFNRFWISGRRHSRTLSPTICRLFSPGGKSRK